MLLLLSACSHPDSPDSPAVDVTERLAAGQVRAGLVTDPLALFGGVAAEGRVGDWKIYNDRAQFVIQQVGDSSYYVEYGGGLVDADIVRDPGEPGRDMLDDLSVMVGLGRVMKASNVEVIDDGSDGVATIRVTGAGAPMQLVTGALESPAIVPDLDLGIVTDFTLRPDSYSIEMTSTITNEEPDAQTLPVGEVAIVSLDVAERWRPGTGLDDPDGSPFEWAAAIGKYDEGTFALLSSPGETFTQGSVGSLLDSIAQTVSGFGPTLTLEPGGSATWTRWVGVAPDPATLSGERLERGGSATQELSGTSAPGARVHVVDADGAPVTMAFADATGAWKATVPEGDLAPVETGRGTGYVWDLPAGHGWPSPYEPDPDTTLATLQNGATPLPFAEGWGVGALVPPGTVHLTIADGGPAVARVCFATGDTVVADRRFVDDRPGGCAEIAYVRDGELDIPAEPGDYVLIVHRGVRDEVDVQNVTVASGETVDVTADVHAAYAIDGVITGDPHTHASPSADAFLTMEERLLTMAANGIDVHFGTDHDHIADYRPLIPAMGLSDRLATIVCDEVSPVLRGHFNMYPAVATLDAANHGAPRWWFGYADTEEIFASMRAVVGDDGIIQANHPVGDSGMFSYAQYDPTTGVVSAPDHWADGFDAVEVDNSGDIDDYLPYYLDLVNRGKYVAPVGVSDSHTPTSGGLGLNQTFFLTGTSLADFTPDVLVDTLHRRATVVSRGPYIDARVDGAFAAGATVATGSTLDVTVYAPSWMPVETVSLLQDGQIVETLPCTGAAPTPCEAHWTLEPFADADYVVIAESTTQPMQWAHAGDYAWAMTSATFVDVEGDGWEPPLPALVMGN